MTTKPRRSAGVSTLGAPVGARVPIRITCLVLLAWVAAALVPGGGTAWAAPDTVALSAVGSGELLCRTADGFTPMPILGMDVSIDITDVLVRGRLDQVFLNPDPVGIEAIYVFPLPEDAAVDAMEIRVGDRIVRAVVRERQEARRTYEEARDTGRKAALIEEERPNLFTASVANIGPGETVTVHLEYLEEIRPEADRYGLHFPLTLTPRYTPDGQSPVSLPVAAGSPASIDPLCDASTVQPPFSQHGTPLAPRAIIEVRLFTPRPFARVESSSHDIVTVTEDGLTTVRTRRESVRADRDFVLEWTVDRGEEPTPSVYAEDVGDDRFLLLTVQPPRPDAAREVAAEVSTETLFVLDVSGSMDGPSIEQAREALVHAVDRLGPGDAFNVLWFNDRYGSFAPDFVPVTQDEVRRARSWIRHLEATGGTEIHPAFLRALELCRMQPNDGTTRGGRRTEAGDSGGAATRPASQRRIVFLTDGAVSNEEALLADVVAKRGEVRIHVVGIGHAPNRFLMQKLAEEGRGLLTSIGGTEEVGPRIEAFLERIDRPVLTDLTLSGLPPNAELVPATLPDLYVDGALQVSVRVPGGARNGVNPSYDGLRLSGRAGGTPWQHDVRMLEVGHGSGIGTRWARFQVDDALGRLRRGADSGAIRTEVIALGLGFHIVTPYTSLVAVEEIATAATPAVPAPVANALPAGSTLGSAIGGGLPRGGTNEPLWTLLGWIALGLGASLAFLAGTAKLGGAR
ncbi:MAG: VIT domain-containing protein [Candidatus Eisenbacteria bacterium]